MSLVWGMSLSCGTFPFMSEKAVSTSSSTAFRLVGYCRSISWKTVISIIQPKLCERMPQAHGIVQKAFYMVFQYSFVYCRPMYFDRHALYQIVSRDGRSCEVCSSLDNISLLRFILTDSEASRLAQHIGV